MGLLARFKQSEYARNSTVLMVGTVISMVLQSVSMIWLGNIYKPEFIGLYQYLSTAYSIFLIVATGRYELAIMLPKEDNDGFLLTLLSAGLSVVFAAVMTVLLLIGQFAFGLSLDWVGFLPLSLAILGIYYSCNYWLNRQKQYKKLALNRVIQGVLFVVFNTGYAFVLPSRRFGMILGYLSAQAVVMFILIIYLVRDYRRYRIQLSFNRIKELAKEYIKFPKISTPSGIINNLAVHLPVLLLGPLAGDAVVGQYSMMNRVLVTPISVISEAIRDVFRQRASKDYAENGECGHTFLSTFKTLSLVAIVPFALLMLVAKPVFSFIFHDTYNMAATFIMLMSPFYYVKFVVSPLTFMTYIAGKQSFDMKWQIAFCISSTLAFLLGSALTHSPYWMMIFFGVAQTILYGISFYYTRKLAKGDYST